MAIWDDMLSRSRTTFDDIWTRSVGGKAPSFEQIGQARSRLAEIQRQQELLRQEQERMERERIRAQLEREEQKEKDESFRDILSKRTDITTREKAPKVEAENTGTGFVGGLRDILGEIGAVGKAASSFLPGGVTPGEAFEEYANRDRGKAVQEVQRGSQRMTNMFSGNFMAGFDRTFNDREPYYTSHRAIGEGGGIDMITSSLGMLGPGGLAAAGLRSLRKTPMAANTTLKGIGQRAGEGALIGGGLTALEEGIDGATGAEDWNAKDAALNVGLGIAGGAILDPIADIGFSKLGQLGQRVISKARQGKSVGQIATEENIGADEVGRIMNEFDQARRNGTSGGMLDGQSMVGRRSGLELPEPRPESPLGLNGPIASNRISGDVTPPPGTELPEPSLYNARYRGPENPQLRETPLLEDNITAQRQQRKTLRDQIKQIDEQIKTGTATPKTRPYERQELNQAFSGNERFNNLRQAPGKNGAKSKNRFVVNFMPSGSKSKATDPFVKVVFDKHGEITQAVTKNAANKEEEIALRGQARGFVKRQLKDLNDARKDQVDVDALKAQRQALRDQLNEIPTTKRQTGDPIEFRKEIQSAADPLSFVRGVDPSTMKTERFDGSFSTQQRDTIYGQALKVVQDSKKGAPELPDLEFKRRVKMNRTQIEQEYIRPLVDEKVPEIIRDIDAKTYSSSAGGVKPQPNSTSTIAEALGAASGKSSGRKATPMSKGVDYRTSKTKSKDTPLTDKVIATILDDLFPVKAAELTVLGRKKYGEAGDIAKRFYNAKGATAKAEMKLNKELMPVMKALQEKGGDVQAGFEYMLARHFKEIRMQKPDYVLPKGLTDADVDKTIADFSNLPEYNEFIEGIQKYNQSILEDMVSSGRLSQANAEQMIKDYPNYVPKFREQQASEGDFEELFFSTGSTTGSPVMSLKDGGESPIQDFIKSYTVYTQKAMQASANNRAFRGLNELAELDKDKRFVSKDASKGGTKIKFYTNGKEDHVYVNSGIAKALQGADNFEKEQLTGMLQRISKAQRFAITGFPAFIIRNLMRDIPQGYINSKAGFGLRDLGLAMVDSMTDGKALGSKSLMDEFTSSGAGLSNIWSQDSREFRKFQKEAYKIKGFKDVPAGQMSAGKFVSDLLDMYRDRVLSGTENIVKLAEYRAAKRKGFSDDAAAYAARDMMDFYKAGSAVRKLNPYVGFLNVTLQGRSKAARALLEAVEAKDGAAIARWSWRNATAAAAPSALAWWATQNYASEDQKNLIDEAPQYLRDTYWLIPNPTNETDVWRIPKPFEAAALVSTPLEWMLRQNDGQDVDFSKEVGEWLKTNVLFDPSLNIAMPFFEVAANKDTFSGADIVPMREQNLPPEEQSDIYTSNLADMLGQGISNVPIIGDTKAASPRVLDHLIGGLLPIAGPNTLQAGERMLDNLGIAEEKNRPANAYTNPFLEPATQFNIRGEGRNSPLLGEFYETAGRVLNGMERNPYTEIPEGVSEDDYKFLTQTRSDINSLATEIRETANDPDMTPEEKQKKLNRLIEERNSLVREAENRGINDLGKR